MQTGVLRSGLARALGVCAIAAGVLGAPAHAARIGVLSNYHAAETAADFGTHITVHTFTALDITAGAPDVSELTSKFDAILLFEDQTFDQAPNVGNTVAAYAKTGRAVVLGTFYEQDRSDGSPNFKPHGWGNLETIDPNTTDGAGTAYALRTLDPGALFQHPLTAGVAALSSTKFAGGNQAKPSTVVLAAWAQKNAKGGSDPAIAYRVTGTACVIHIAIAPDYPTVGTFGVDFGGDFYRAWRNAFDFAALHCPSTAAIPPFQDAASVPTLTTAAVCATALLLALAGGLARRRLARR